MKEPRANPARAGSRRLPAGRRAGLVLAAVLALALGGCAGHQAYKEGQALLGQGRIDAGLAKLEEAIRLEPGNAEFRIGLALRRSTLLNRLYAAGESAHREGRPDDAERLWREVLRLEPQHAMARQGLDVLAVEARNRTLLKEAETLYEQGGLAQAGPALDRLRAVLSVEPSNKAAQRLVQRIEEARLRETPVEARLAAAFRKPIGLQFNDAPLRAIFDAISRISGLELLLRQGRAPRRQGHDPRAQHHRRGRGAAAAADQPARAQGAQRQHRAGLPEHAAEAEGVPDAGGAQPSTWPTPT